MFEDYATAHPDELWKAIDRGIKAKPPKSFQYLNLLTMTIDGKDADVVAFDQVQRLIVALTALFLEIVTDVEQKRRWIEGVRRLTGVRSQPQAIDAESQTTE